MRRSLGVIVCAVVGCSGSEPELRPSTVSQRGGVELVVDTGTSATGPAVVLVDGVAAHMVVIEAPGLLRARLPSLPNIGLVDIEVSFGDGSTVHMEDALEVVAPRLDVRARD